MQKLLLKKARLLWSSEGLLLAMLSKAVLFELFDVGLLDRLQLCSRVVAFD